MTKWIEYNRLYFQWMLDTIYSELFCQWAFVICFFCMALFLFHQGWYVICLSTLPFGVKRHQVKAGLSKKNNLSNKATYCFDTLRCYLIYENSFLSKDIHVNIEPSTLCIEFKKKLLQFLHFIVPWLNKFKVLKIWWKIDD